MSETTQEACPQAWHGGLRIGLLRECAQPRGHRGWHKSADGHLHWGGALTAEEMALAEAMRTAGGAA